MKIAISGLNNTDNPAPGIGVAKGLKDYELIGLSYDVNEPGVYQNIFDHVFLMPFPSVGWDDVKNRLLEIKQKVGLDILIPTLDAELPLLIKYQDELKKLGIKMLLPSFEQFKLREKANLGEFCEKLGVKYPKTIKIASLEDLYAALKEIGYPCMIKGNYYKAFKAYNLDEAVEYFYAISNEWGFPLLVQEIVNGVEINYVGISFEKLYGGVGIKKLTTTNLGKVWEAISIKNERLITLTEKFVELSKWRGAFEVEAIAAGNEIYLIEINPRFPAWVNFATQLGINLPKMMVDLINEKEVKKVYNYPENKLYVRYVEEAVVDFDMYKKLLAKKEI